MMSLQSPQGNAGQGRSGAKAGKAGGWLLPQGIDLMLLVTICGTVVFGLLMLFSASFIFAEERTGDGLYFIKKQLVYALLGFLSLLVACRLDYRRWARWSYPVLALTMALLIAVLIPGVGSRVLGARRWIQLGPVTFQPGELAKFGVILFVASQLNRKHEGLHRFLPGAVAPLLVAFPAMALLLAQPDFGTAVLIGVVIFSLMFLAGVPLRFLSGAMALGGAAAAWLALGSPYRRQRVRTFFDPWADPGGKGFQILQSMLGLHNGHLTGAGLGNGREKLFYLPEAHNDFILAVIGEELGFVGVAILVVVYIAIVYFGLRIALNCQKRHQDRFGMLLATGITLALGLQAFVNMAVVMGLVPTKGLTLPFVSYGGSALLVDLFAVGVLLSVGRGPGAGKSD